MKNTMKFLAASLVLAAIAGIAASTSPQLRNTVSENLQTVLPVDMQADEHPAHPAAHAEAHEPLHEAHTGNSAEASADAHDSHAGHHARHKIVTTSPAVQDVTLTQPFVCQIHSRRHIDIKAIEGGYLESIEVNEGQWVHKGDVMFHILPTLYKARVDADVAEAKLAQVEYDNTKNLVDQNIISPQELKLARAKLDKALAQVALAQAEMNFADIKAPFDGIVDRLHEQEGSLIEEGSLLTTMSDNSVMWVYFNVPEKYYLDFQRATLAGRRTEELNIQLRLANHEIFNHTGVIGAIEADFDNETGNISFRADFPNPDGLLRHGQTGTILINQNMADAIVIPQRATFEILAKKYVFTVDLEGTVHQREINIAHELEDVFVVDQGLTPKDKIVLEGVLQVRDGETVEAEYVTPAQVMSQLKYHAE